MRWKQKYKKCKYDDIHKICDENIAINQKNIENINIAVFKRIKQQDKLIYEIKNQLQQEINDKKVCHKVCSLCKKRCPIVCDIKVNNNELKRPFCSFECAALNFSNNLSKQIEEHNWDDEKKTDE